MLKISELKFDADGLIPAVVTDFYTKKVLTVAYMNAASLEISMREGKTCFYSRSRKKLWRKGETSGNYQNIVAIKADCDRDALTVEVVKSGPACHLGTDSCFNDYVYISDELEEFSVADLYKLIDGRKTDKKEGSYTNYLFEQGIDKILKKVGEESAEVLIAGKGGDKAETVYEIADLVYHLLVLMSQMQITPADVIDELKKRHVIDKKVKQQRMQ
ncbi:bifunctional phosphoribosyl-AMP cyclohydrolase/phosphoribosyl-ATP diphosphatase HisIE [Anaerocaecibacter muris]|uniref:bifunctional phosphoribosyl-AMP cyclohydrolase/phosphoribosyl-ATP diphosphatase HisIE n=1 Tax=Anaerocaecibacter muris TaxID=2941513 RepID=UPI003F68CA09